MAHTESPKKAIIITINVSDFTYLPTQYVETRHHNFKSSLGFPALGK
jgi:hypothetical protein